MKAKVSLEIYDIINWEISGKYLPNISRGKGNQTIKNHEKLCTKCDGETCLKHFFKKLKLYIYLDQQSEISSCLFYSVYCMSRSTTIYKAF